VTRPGWGGYRKTESRTDESVEVDRLNRRIRGHLMGIAIANRAGDTEGARDHSRYLASAHDELIELLG